MSLLLDALKKAEKAKEEAQRRTGAEQRAPAPLQLQEEAPAKPVLTRRELPDISSSLEILSDDIDPKEAGGAGEPRAPANTPFGTQARAREASKQADRAT